ncbi:MAG: gliding motility protein GldL [Bacteroidetes bacterium]|nr:MAG: gliding motility protein GldL [Bacteroidota bacterium]
MGLLNFVKSKQYKHFMAKLYGWGASVVIIGALFKINHYMGADIMLIIGLGTESIIFFFSAFEPPHVEPDWSLVYPQRAGMYHDVDIDATQALASGETVSQELDKMLEKAKIGPELIGSLGIGLRTLADTTSKLGKMSDAAVTSDQFVSSVKQATDGASKLSDSYRKTASVLDQSVSTSQEQLQHMQSAAKSAAGLSNAYTEVANSLKEEIRVNKDMTSSISAATASANKFMEKYNESAEVLTKTAATLSSSATENENYNKQMNRVSSNLSALNALYELHLQGSNEQMENTNKFNAILGKFADNLTESVTNTAKYKESLALLNKVVEKQLQTSTSQVEASSQIEDSMKRFLDNLNASVTQTARFKEQVDSLASNIAAMNKVYGNMLSAMNVTLK